MNFQTLLILLYTFSFCQCSKVWALGELHQHFPEMCMKNKPPVPIPGLLGVGHCKSAFSQVPPPGNRKQAESLYWWVGPVGEWDKEGLHLPGWAWGRDKGSVERWHVSGCLKDGRSLDGSAATESLVLVQPTHPRLYSAALFSHSTLEENFLQPMNCSLNYFLFLGLFIPFRVAYTSIFSSRV